MQGTTTSPRSSSTACTRLINIKQEQLRKVKELLEAGTIGYCIGWGATRFEDRTTPVFITKPEDADKFILALDEFSSKHSVEFTVALSGDAASASDVMKKYL